MSVYDKSIKNVAEVAAKIMDEAKKPLHPNQQKLDVHEPEKDELTKKDFEMLRAGKKAKMKEETELQEMKDMIDALILEYESKGGVYKHKGTYGTAKGAEYGETDYAKENDMAKAADKPAKKKYGARQNYVRSTRVNESFTELLEKYTEGGVKALNESLYVAEEADNEQFHAEVEVNKKKAEGKVKQPEVAKGAVKAVAITKEEVEQIDESDLGNGYKIKMKHIDKGRIHSPSGEHVADVTRHESGWQYHSGNSKWDGTEKSPHYKTGVEKTKMAAARKAAQIHMNEEVEQIDERQMTEPEMKKREEIVKSMKKGMAGFKQRYGERAKSVMYATATKQAMKD